MSEAFPGEADQLSEAAAAAERLCNEALEDARDSREAAATIAAHATEAEQFALGQIYALLYVGDCIRARMAAAAGDWPLARLAEIADRIEITHDPKAAPDGEA